MPMTFGPHITRRDFLNGTLLGVGTALVGTGTMRRVHHQDPDNDWYGYGGVGDYRFSHGNTPEVVGAAHRLRNGGYPLAAVPTGRTEDVDLVIVGAGFAGLGAALEFVKKRQDGQTCLMLDNHPIFGGEAKENEFAVGGTRLIGPQGSNGFFLPPPVSDIDSAFGDARYFAELGVPRVFRLHDWPATERPLGFSRDNYEYLVRGLEHHTSVGHFFSGARGSWAVDVWRNRWAGTQLPEPVRDTLLRWHDWGAARHFATDDAAIRALDTISYEQFLDQELHLPPDAARYADLFLASACGLGSDAISAYVAYQLPMPGLTDALPADLRRTSFPGGNSGFARYFVKRLIPDAIAGQDTFEDIVTGQVNWRALDRPGRPLRLRLRSTVVSVEHEKGSPTASRVRVIYARGDGLYEVRAKAVVMATGGWMNRYVVRDMPPEHRAAYEQFVHAPFLVANVALNNWRFLHRLGITAAVWNRTDEGFGFTCNIRNPMQIGAYQPPLDPDKPVILSFYTPFHRPGLPLREQTARGRAELLSTSYREYERRIKVQMETLFADAGFDAERDVAGLILNRWGHALSVPFAGFFGGASGTAPRDIIRRSYGRIAFAHSELNGWQHWGPAAEEGRRAYSQLRDTL
jgi:spermidine dehydrogenase